MQRVLDVLHDHTGAGKPIPSASLCVRVDGVEVFHHTSGFARLDPPRSATENEAYDLASLTKALAAAPVTACLVEQGRLGFDDRVCSHLPGVDPRMLVRHLLTHSSGVPWWRPLYEQANDAWGTAATRERLLDLAQALPLEAPPGERHSYSDIGMLLLHRIFDAITGQRFDVLHRTLITGPLGLDDLRFGGWPCAAATELCPVRGILIEGTVHDLNTAALGGISTHAGLFGTARAVARLADALMHAVLAPARHPHLPGQALGAMWGMDGPGSHAGIWDRRTPGLSSSGRFWPDDSRGHTGYTGTSVWCAPSRRTTVALLTNRVHPRDDKEPIKILRPLVHDAVALTLGWKEPA